MHSSLPLRLVAVLALTSSVNAQVTYDQYVVASPKLAAGNGFGYSLLSTDIDRDGFADLVVGEIGADGQGILDVGRGWVLYGPTFSKHQELVARPPMEKEFMAWRRGAAGDLDADGNIDLVLVSPLVDIGGFLEVGRAHVFFGPSFDEDLVLSDPTPQPKAHFGYNALVVGGEPGRQGVLYVAAPDAWLVPEGTQSTFFAGEVIAWLSGLGAPPSVIPNPEPQQFSGLGCALLQAQWNADGVPDLLVGRARQDGVGDILVLDGTTQAAILEIDAPPETTSYEATGFGFAHFYGDVTGDGSSDLVVGAPLTRVSDEANAGMLFILDGQDFTHVVHAFLPPVPANDGYFGEEVQVTDLDVDGHLDLVVNSMGDAFTDDDNAAYLYFGPGFTRIQTVHVTAKGFGQEAVTGDFDGDGAPELAVGALWGNDSGRVHVFDRRSLSADVSEIPIAAGASIELQLDLGAPSAGLAYVAGLSLSGSSPGLILAPGSYVPLQVDGMTMIGLALVGSPILEGFTGTLDADGRAELILNWPAAAGAGLAGQCLTIAAIAIGADGRPKAGSSPVGLSLSH